MIEQQDDKPDPDSKKVSLGRFSKSLDLPQGRCVRRRTPLCGWGGRRTWPDLRESAEDALVRAPNASFRVFRRFPERQPI
jgi:hypothetical protein